MSIKFRFNLRHTLILIIVSALALAALRHFGLFSRTGTWEVTSIEVYKEVDTAGAEVFHHSAVCQDGYVTRTFPLAHAIGIRLEPFQLALAVGDRFRVIGDSQMSEAGDMAEFVELTDGITVVLRK